MGEYDAKPPSEIGLILGDALHNYRAALDHLAWQIVNAAGTPKNTRSVYFPVVTAAARFPEDLQKKMPGVSNMVASIVQRFQPFTNGSRSYEHPFAILHAWNNIDKHRALPVTAMSSVKLNVTLPGEYENFEIWKQEHRAEGQIEYLLPGVELIRIYGRRRDRRRDHGVKVRFEGLATIAHESGRTLESTMDKIDGLVNEVLTEFEGVSDFSLAPKPRTRD